MFDQLDDYEFERGEQMHSDYNPDRINVPTCVHLYGYWKNIPCGDPVHGESDRCEAHFNSVTLGELLDALKAGDLECAEMHLEDMGLTLDDLKGRGILQLAA